MTDVKAKTKEDKSSHLAFNLDHAVLKGGKEVPVVVIVTSVTGPQGPPTDVMSGGGSSGVPGGSPGAAGSTGSSAAPTASAPIVTSSRQSQSSQGGVLKNTQDRVPVAADLRGHLPMLLTYTGPLDGVELPTLGVAVDRGGTVEVPDELGAALLEQACWDKATTTSKTTKAAGVKGEA